MKRLLTLMLAAALALSLVACGGSGGTGDNSTPSTGNGDTTSTDTPSGGGEDSTSEETPENDEKEVPGVYEHISLFLNSTYEWHENGSYDRTNPEEKGTYSVADNGDVIMSKKGGYNEGDTYSPYGDYYYRSNDRNRSSGIYCAFEKDKEYGLAPSFDENGRSSQTFHVCYERIDSERLRDLNFTMNEDGTFILENITTYKTSIAMRDTFEGEYILEDDILTLKWHGFEVPFLYIDGKIYFDIIVKVQTGETVSPMKVIDKALQGAWVHEDTTITFADGRFTYDYIRVSDGEREVNEGDYRIGPATITLVYDSGADPELDYTFEDGVLSLFGEKGIPPVQFNYIKQE